MQAPKLTEINLNPQSRVPSMRTLRTTLLWLGRIRGHDGITVIQQPDGGLAIGMTGAFSGTAYVGGVKTTGLTSDATKPYVRCNRTYKTAVEHGGPIPDPLPADEEWYAKATTYGDIHLW